MSYIKWLEVEGVRYEGLGDSISCQTAVGFHSQLPGMRLEDLEISDVHGSTLGYLTADFTTGHLVIAPVVSAAELASTHIVIDDEGGMHNVSLDELPLSSSKLSSLVESEVEFIDLSVLTTSICGQSEYFVALTSVVSDSDETLDAFFGESCESFGAQSPLTKDEDASLTYTSLYFEHGAEPLQMPLLTLPPDLI